MRMRFSNLSLFKQITWTLVAMCLAATTAQFLVQHFQYSQSFDTIFQTVRQGAIQQKQSDAQAILREVLFATNSSLQRGEKEVFMEFARQQKSIEEIQEFSFVGKSGKVGTLVQHAGREPRHRAGFVEPTPSKAANASSRRPTTNSISTSRFGSTPTCGAWTPPAGSAMCTALYLQFSKAKINAMVDDAGESYAKASRWAHGHRPAHGALSPSASVREPARSSSAASCGRCSGRRVRQARRRGRPDADAQHRSPRRDRPVGRRPRPDGAATSRRLRADLRHGRQPGQLVQRPGANGHATGQRGRGDHEPIGAGRRRRRADVDQHGQHGRFHRADVDQRQDRGLGRRGADRQHRRGGQSAERTAGVAGNAAQLVSASNAQIGELGGAADEIGKVIEVIQDIAEQTNLLALERHDRGGPGRRRRQGLRRRGHRGQGTGQADRFRHRGHPPADRGHSGFHGPRRQVDRRNQRRGQAGQRALADDRLGRRGAEHHHQGDRQEHAAHRRPRLKWWPAAWPNRPRQPTRSRRTSSASIRRPSRPPTGAAQTQTAGRELSEVAEQFQALVAQFIV